MNEAIYLARKDVVFFDPVTVKFLTKLDPTIMRGDMQKCDMVDALNGIRGLKGPFNHNEADAYHVARFLTRF